MDFQNAELNFILWGVLNVIKDLFIYFKQRVCCFSCPASHPEIAIFK